MAFSSHIGTIIEEIQTVLKRVDETEVEKFVTELQKAHHVVVVGAGRVGMAARGFAMRLGHLGLHGFSLGDSTVPALGKGDMLVVASGSGETQTVYDLVEIAKKHGAFVVLITGNRQSRMGALADHVVEIKAPSKVKPVENFSSRQPMTTLNEQCLMLFFDAVVLMLMEQRGETHESMWDRHSVLE